MDFGILWLVLLKFWIWSYILLENNPKLKLRKTFTRIQRNRNENYHGNFIALLRPKFKIGFLSYYLNPCRVDWYLVHRLLTGFQLFFVSPKCQGKKGVIPKIREFVYFTFLPYLVKKHLAQSQIIAQWSLMWQNKST